MGRTIFAVFTLLLVVAVIFVQETVSLADPCGAFCDSATGKGITGKGGKVKGRAECIQKCKDGNFYENCIKQGDRENPTLSTCIKNCFTFAPQPEPPASA
ncbi:Hypothetical predicted protein [Mytilus galloprovincialis]|uniref:Uncharacterized protein n=1 Tax=Mytilus galloprovincialis TaxID=29158 RepID=A0A8B6HA70_MYTGA|nr:Hypothetical predicted protein [Mytilus galloprovincialis]